MRWRRSGVTTPATQDVVRIVSPGARRGTGDGRIRAGDLVVVRRRRRGRRLRRRGGADLAGRTGRCRAGTTPPSSDLYRRWDDLWAPPGRRLPTRCARPAACSRRTARPANRFPLTPVGTRPRPRLRRPGDRRANCPSTASPSARPGRRPASSPHAVFDDTAGSVVDARGGPHHPRRTGGAVAQPVLEPRASRSPPMTDNSPTRRRPSATRPTGSSTRRTRRRRSPRSRSTGPTGSTRRRSAMRLRYADLLHQANIDDDVKVLVIRGDGRRLRHRRRTSPSSWRRCGTEDGLLREVRARGRRRHVPAAPQLPPRRHGHPVVHRPARRLPHASRSSRRSASSRSRATATAGTSTKPATPTSSSRPTTRCSATPRSATPARRPRMWWWAHDRWASASSRRWSSPAARSPPRRWPSAAS